MTGPAAGYRRSSSTRSRSSTPTASVRRILQSRSAWSGVDAPVVGTKVTVGRRAAVFRPETQRAAAPFGRDLRLGRDGSGVERQIGRVDLRHDQAHRGGERELGRAHLRRGFLPPTTFDRNMPTTSCSRNSSARGLPTHYDGPAGARRPIFRRRLQQTSPRRANSRFIHQHVSSPNKRATSPSSWRVVVGWQRFIDSGGGGRDRRRTRQRTGNWHLASVGPRLRRENLERSKGEVGALMACSTHLKDQDCIACGCSTSAMSTSSRRRRQKALSYHHRGDGAVHGSRASAAQSRGSRTEAGVFAALPPSPPVRRAN